MIALTGATGAVGSRVARLLAAEDLPLRLLLRDPRRAPDVPAETAVITGYLDTAGVTAGLHGCSTLLLVSGRESADRVREHRTVIESAVAAGIRRIVYLSFQGAAPDATFTFARDHWHTEQILAQQPLTTVVLRDCFYLAALAGLAGADGVIRGPAGDGTVAGVAHDDVAAVAAAALRSDEWDGSTLDVTGPASLSLDEVAAQLSEVSGRAVRYERETETEAYASRAHYGVPDFEVAGWVSSYQAIATGEVASVTDTVPRLTGRPAQDLAAYLRSHPKAWSHLVG